MNWLDVLIVLSVLLCLIRGLMRGFVSEVIALVVVVFGALGARYMAPPFSGAIQEAFAWPAGTCDVIAYVLIFLIIAIILSVIARGTTRFLNAIHLGWANTLLGGAFAVCKAGLIILIAVFILERTNDEYHYLDDAPILKESTLYPKLVQATHDLLSFSREQHGQS